MDSATRSQVRGIRGGALPGAGSHWWAAPRRHLALVCPSSWRMRRCKTPREQQASRPTVGDPRSAQGFARYCEASDADGAVGRQCRLADGRGGPSRRIQWTRLAFTPRLLLLAHSSCHAAFRVLFCADNPDLTVRLSLGSCGHEAGGERGSAPRQRSASRRYAECQAARTQKIEEDVALSGVNCSEGSAFDEDDYFFVGGFPAFTLLIGMAFLPGTIFMAMGILGTSRLRKECVLTCVRGHSAAAVHSSHPASSLSRYAAHLGEPATQQQRADRLIKEAKEPPPWGVGLLSSAARQ